jgi:hypothetical protein
MTTGDNVNVTEDFARLGPATVCGTEDRGGQEFVIVRPAEPDGWEDFGNRKATAPGRSRGTKCSRPRPLNHPHRRRA